MIQTIQDDRGRRTTPIGTKDFDRIYLSQGCLAENGYCTTIPRQVCRKSFGKWIVRGTRKIKDAVRSQHTADMGSVPIIFRICGRNSISRRIIAMRVSWCTGNSMSQTEIGYCAGVDNCDNGTFPESGIFPDLIRSAV